MTIAKFVDNLSERLELTKKDTDKVVKAVLAEIMDCLARGEKVKFMGFGSFEVSNMAPRKGRNPQTGEEINIAAHKRTVFRAGKKLREKLGSPVAVIERSIEELGLSSKTCALLKNNGINLESEAKARYDQLSSIKGLGKKALDEIKLALKL